MAGVLQRTLGRSRARLAAAVGRLVPGCRVSAEDLDDLEAALLSADVGPETAEHLLTQVREAGVDAEQVRQALRSAMLEVLVDATTAPRRSAAGPRVELVVGVNGSGKTTSAAKLARWHQRAGRTPILGAADTFRAAAVEQLVTWGDRLGVDVIAQGQGADPAAVAFDTCEAARARSADVAIIDTAGRLHTHDNLMAELDKVRRVTGRVVDGAPHEVLLVLDATTGQNGLRQAEQFLAHAGVTGLLLAKLDGTARGGVALAIARQLALPIRFIGTGEGADDLAAFDARAYVDGLLGADAA